MKTIQWFPGHMTKAMRMMREQLSLVDGVIFVLDARCPAASFNEKLKNMAQGKPVLYVLNKGDLADERTDNILKVMREAGASAIKLNAVNASSRRDITGAIAKLVEEKRAKALEKGFNKTFRFMVAGVPNTGKSTIINLIAGAGKAETGNKAGVTRAKQWVRCGDFDLLDTPGTMPPAFENQYLATHLAYVGSINDDILDMDDVALALLGELYERYPSRLKARYGIEDGDPTGMLETVCRRRGFMLRGGEFDYERAERAVIEDFRKGKLGRITLDTTEDARGLRF